MAKSSSEKLPVTFIPNQNTEIAMINNTSIKLIITKYNTEYIESKTGYKNSMGVDVEYRTWFNNKPDAY